MYLREYLDLKPEFCGAGTVGSKALSGKAHRHAIAYSRLHLPCSLLKLCELTAALRLRRGLLQLLRAE